jgi:hypothetical protein
MMTFDVQVSVMSTLNNTELLSLFSDSVHTKFSQMSYISCSEWMKYL